MCENLGAIEMLEYGIKLLDFVNTAMNVRIQSFVNCLFKA